MAKRDCSLAKRIFKKIKRKVERANFQIETRDVLISFEEQIKKENLPIHSTLIHAPRGGVILVLYLQQERYAIYMGTNYQQVKSLDLFHFPNISTLTPVCRDPHRLPLLAKGLKRILYPYTGSLEALDRLALT